MKPELVYIVRHECRMGGTWHEFMDVYYSEDRAIDRRKILESLHSMHPRMFKNVKYDVTSPLDCSK